MKVVISLGGSVILKDNSVNEKFLGEFSKLILNTKNNYQIICGGGSVARIYTRANIPPIQKDLLGIAVTKINAQLLASFFGNKAKLLFKNPLLIGKDKNRIVISAGWKPGVTTDYDAALICKTFKPDMLVNISNVKWIYDKDPRKFKSAKKIEKMNYGELSDLSKNVKRTSGMNFIFDPRATQVLMKEKITSVFVDSSISNLKNVLEGKKFVGTTVVCDSK